MREAVYNAAWADNLDIADEAVLADVLTAAGFDAEGLIGRASDPEIKAALRANTTVRVAVACGVLRCVCGVCACMRRRDGVFLAGFGTKRSVFDPFLLFETSLSSG